LPDPDAIDIRIGVGHLSAVHYAPAHLGLVGF